MSLENNHSPLGILEWVAGGAGSALGWLHGTIIRSIVDAFGPWVYFAPVIAGIVLAVVLKFV